MPDIRWDDAARRMQATLRPVREPWRRGQYGIDMGIPIVIHGIQDIFDVHARIGFAVDPQHPLKEQSIRILVERSELQESLQLAAYGNIAVVPICGPQPSIQNMKLEQARYIGDAQPDDTVIQLTEPLHQCLTARQMVEDPREQLGLEPVWNLPQEQAQGLLARLV